MKKQRKGGSRLEKNIPEHDQATRRDSAQADGGKPGMAKWKKVLLIVLAAAVVVLLVLVIVHQVLVNMPHGSEDAAPLPMVDPVTGDQLPDNLMSKATRKKDFYTFLVVGRDTGGGGNTDTMMLAAYDIPNQKLSIMSIPRDTMVDARHPDHNRKLNGVWNLGLYYAKKDEKKEGIEYLREAVGDMVSFVPDFYFVVSWESFGRLVDAIGGVEFEVPFHMKYDDPTQNLHIDVAAGKRVLTGEEAMGVVRWRHNNSGGGYATGDVGRIGTQQALMKEVIKKCLKIENITKFANIFLDEVDTNLTVGNLVAFAERAILGGLKMENVLFTTMPNTPIYVNGESYVQANPDELLGVLNDCLNPYKEDIPMEALHILQYSSSRGYYIYSGTGTGSTPVYTAPKPAAMVGGSKADPTPSPEPSEEASPEPDVDSSSEPADSSAEPSVAPDASARPSDDPDVSPRPSDAPDDDAQPSQAPGDAPEPSDDAPAPSEPPADEPEPPETVPETSEPSEPEPTPSSTGPQGIVLD